MRRVFDTTPTSQYPFWIFDGKQTFWADKNRQFAEKSGLSLASMERRYKEVLEIPDYLEVDEGL